jgi:hypothetical protein
MNKEELFQKSQSLKDEGDFLLQDSKLLELLSEYGEVHVTGAYSVNLMAHGDIDLYVVLSPFDKHKVHEVLNKLIKQDYFRGYYYGDYIKNPKEGFPNGYYIGLNTIHGGEFWKFDIWFVHETDKEKDTYMEFIKNNLTDDSKYEILKLKTERNEKEDIPSYEIYKKVLG